MIELAKGMAKDNFWKRGDVELMKAWVEDLISVGYQFPVPVHSY